MGEPDHAGTRTNGPGIAREASSTRLITPADHMLDWLHKTFPGIEFALAGLIGAICAIPYHKDITTKSGFVTFFITGAASGYYAAPYAASYFGLGASGTGLAAFGIGVFAGSAISKVISTLQALDLVGIIRRKLGGGE